LSRPWQISLDRPRDVVNTCVLTFEVVDSIFRATIDTRSKTDVGGYAYTSTRPHAITAAAGVVYGYDAKGQLITASGDETRAITWSGFGQVERLTYRGRTTDFIHDHSYKRISEVPGRLRCWGARRRFCDGWRRSLRSRFLVPSRICGRRCFPLWTTWPIVACSTLIGSWATCGPQI
jgi:hypothetical protein